MSFFISEAWAENGAAVPPGEPSALLSMLPLLIIFLIFYFLLIRPQSKRAKDHKKMVEALGKGDEVVTNGGMMGRITNLSDEVATIEIAAGVEVKMQRQYITSVLPKGTLKSV